MAQVTQSSSPHAHAAHPDVRHMPSTLLRSGCASAGDRWARQRRADWTARHIIEVQRKFAYDIALAGKRLS
jgi:hypothetical protein